MRLHRRDGVFLLIAVVGCAFGGCSEEPPESLPAKQSPPAFGGSQPNVVFIVVDDLNDWVGSYGDGQAVTPNIDRLAEQGVLFERAYCAAPMCNASRASVMSGMYPYSTGIYEDEPLLYNRPDLVTLPAHFRSNGYSVHGGGKVFHQTGGNIAPSMFDEYYHWKEGAAARAGGMDYPGNYAEVLGADRNQMAFTETAKESRAGRFDFYAFDDRLEALVADSLVTGWAVDFLGQTHDKPFMLAVGLYSPHKPNYAPQHYYDLYPEGEITLPRVLEGDLEDLPKRVRNLREQRAKGHYDSVVKHDEWGGYVRGYLASLSYADAQIGRILDALESSEYGDNTVVVFWSDNGYHLGEKKHWGKKTLWERATHVPVIIAGPGIAGGGRSGTPVSLVDLYPTLIDLCGVPVRDTLDGRSLVGLLKDPSREDDRHIITTWQHPGDKKKSLRKPNISVRSRQWRYSWYVGGEEELYDEARDPEEWHNLAGDPEYAGVLAGMKKHLPGTVVKGGVQMKDLKVVVEDGSFRWVLRPEAASREK